MEILAAVLWVIGAFIPALIWLVLFTREDIHPEPRAMILRAFLFGAFATVPALAAQLAIGQIGSVVGGSITIGVLSVIEESAKFIGAFLAVRFSRVFDEPVDAMVYLIASGLGFATVENVFSVLSQTGNIFSASFALESLALRFIGATLLHTLASALVGYMWARGIKRCRASYGIIAGIAIGTVVHAVFNILLAEFSDFNILIPTVFLISVAFFVFRDFDIIQRSN